MAQNYTPKPDGIDIIKISECFDKSLELDSGVDINSFNDAFQELARFFDMMGVLFASMASDMRDQIKILERYLQSGERDYYTTVQQIVTFEKADPDHRLEPKKKDASGSRTVLHLIRTLDFFIQFIGKMNDSGDEEKLPGICNPVYKATLGKHHSWLLSKAAGLAIATLPSKIQLYERTSKYSYAQTSDGLKKMVESMKRVFCVTDQLFTKQDLQKLPF